MICMEDKLANVNTQALSEEAVSDVNPTVLIGVFIAVKHIFYPCIDDWLSCGEFFMR